jgi:hypothetical protein
MDPYIEACDLWEDFHDSLVSEIKLALAEVVPDRYVVRGGERSYIVLAPSGEESEREVRSQAVVAVRFASGSPEPSAAAVRAVVDVDAPEAESPVSMRALIESEHRESFLEIRELRSDRRLVTTIEILSPSNKKHASPGWNRYCRKRQAHLEGHANLVEIDLLRGGRRMPMEQEWPGSPYYLLVARKERAPECTVWPAHFLRPLPEIPVPLAPPDPDVSLLLQPLVDSIYRRSRYESDIDYEQPCRPPLSPEHAAWLKERLRESRS